MTLAIGDYFPGAKTKMLKAGSTVAITKGHLLIYDSSNGGYIKATATTTTLGPYAVCVEAMATGGTQVLACVGGDVAVETTNAVKPGQRLQASTSTAGKVMAYAARTINVTTASTEAFRVVGTMWSDNEDLGDGTLPVDAAANDVVIIRLREN